MSLNKQLGFYISPELYTRVKERAAREDKKMSEIIRHLLYLWVEGKLDNEALI